MNASQPRKPTASSPRTATPDGRPRAARSVPAGSSVRSAGSATARPAAASSTSSAVPSSSSAARKTPVPAASASAAASRRGAGDAPGAGSARRPGSVSAMASGRNGSRKTNTQRHVAWSATNPATAGPASDGSTHAEDISASMRPYISGGYARLDDA